jgi:hypothetical protein
MLKEILKAIGLLFDTLRFGAEEAVKKAKPYANLYIKGLILLALISILSPIPFLIIAIIGDWRWLIALTGLWWALWAFLLLVAAVPIGILIESLTGGIKGSGQRYIKLISGILLIGLCISLFGSVIPIKANLSMFPLLIVAAVILGILNIWMFSRKVIAPLVSIIFIALILSFYLPTTFETLGEKISDMDISMGEPKRLHITYEDIEKQRVKFFRSDGKPKAWFYKTEDGKFELFDKKGHHPIFKKKLEPVTPDVVFQIENQLRVDIERRTQEEHKKQEEIKKLEELRVVENREDFLKRYLLNRSFINRAESQEIAVLVVDENNKVNHEITRKIKSKLKTMRLNVTTSFFTGQFVSDGLFQKIFEGNAGEVRNLELLKHLDHIVLCKKTVKFTENPEMQNMITAQTVIEIHIISAKSGVIEESFTESEVGAGFSKATAEDAAKERILKKLTEKDWSILRKKEA